MATRWIVALPLALGAVQAPAHPGHPALDAAHTHGPFGADPLYALLALGAVLVSAALWRVRRRGAPGAVRARRGLRAAVRRGPRRTCPRLDIRHARYSSSMACGLRTDELRHLPGAS